MARDKKRRVPLAEELPTGEDAFAEAAASLGFDVRFEDDSLSGDKELPKEDSPSDISDFLKGRKAGLRIERKGRRGKTVTMVEGLGLDDVSLKSVAKELRKALGCGSSVEDSRVVLQGDNRERAGRWLSDRGVRVRV